ncbi:glycosyltransferase family 2 protein [Denitromonas ohlonensis]|uniref:Glycosyltransferase family 2 protein n=2 Tax=Denitromonas TaxID=139331 RepID=A0A557SE86_9RHOO|nr:glycosyltransferase family 2 protein [Denitromonas ohlonensis]TVO60281.1 glycosyltransferase family 2 protein [Denitromonas ohlonensis]TVO75740.1 glycosyltransferase family 2 protein [Denitromonas ohlonensis]
MISVCLAAYNGAAHIRQQIDSILSQLSAADELIISDDGSTDATRDLVAAIADTRIRLIDGPRKGLIRNFEHALGNARGDLVFLCDQDDLWLPDKVERMAIELDIAMLAVSDCRVVDDSLNLVHPSFFALNGSRPGFIRNLLKNGYLGCCMAFRRELLSTALPFPSHLPMHDWWLGLVGQMTGGVRFIDTPLSLYRRHGGNASISGEKSTFPLHVRLRWRLYLLVQLAKRRLRAPSIIRNTPP